MGAFPSGSMEQKLEKQGFHRWKWGPTTLHLPVNLSWNVLGLLHLYSRKMLPRRSLNAQ